MIKTKIIETTEKYDKDGKLVEKITREETSEDNAVYPTTPTYPIITTTPYYSFGEPWCSATRAENAQCSYNHAVPSECK